MSKGKVGINKIEIELDGDIIKLSLEEARELKDILNDTFPDEGMKELEELKKKHDELSPQPPYQPIIIDRYYRYSPRWQYIPNWEWNTPYCGGSVTADDPVYLWK